MLLFVDILREKATYQKIDNSSPFERVGNFHKGNGSFYLSHFIIPEIIINGSVYFAVEIELRNRHQFTKQRIFILQESQHFNGVVKGDGLFFQLFEQMFEFSPFIRRVLSLKRLVSTDHYHKHVIFLPAESKFKLALLVWLHLLVDLLKLLYAV